MKKETIKKELKKIISSYNSLKWDEITDDEKLHPNLISDGDIPFYRDDIFKAFPIDYKESTILANKLIDSYNSVKSLSEFIYKNVYNKD